MVFANNVDKSGEKESPGLVPVNAKKKDLWGSIVEKREMRW